MKSRRVSGRVVVPATIILLSACTAAKHSVIGARPARIDDNFKRWGVVVRTIRGTERRVEGPRGQKRSLLELFERQTPTKPGPVLFRRTDVRVETPTFREMTRSHKYLILSGRFVGGEIVYSSNCRRKSGGSTVPSCSILRGVDWP